MPSATLVSDSIELMATAKRTIARTHATMAAIDRDIVWSQVVLSRSQDTLQQSQQDWSEWNRDAADHEAI